MGPIRKFLGLSIRDKVLLAKALCLVASIRLGLWLLPFRVLRAFLNSISRPAARTEGREDAAMDQAIWAVETSSRFLPKATCLTKALAARVLLTRLGYPAELRLGVTREESGRILAHAWIESGGRIVIGGNDSPHRFASFPPLSEHLH